MLIQLWAHSRKGDDSIGLNRSRISFLQSYIATQHSSDSAAKHIAGTIALLFGVFLGTCKWMNYRIANNLVKHWNTQPSMTAFPPKDDSESQLSLSAFLLWCNYCCCPVTSPICDSMPRIDPITSVEGELGKSKSAMTFRYWVLFNLNFLHNPNCLFSNKCDWIWSVVIHDHQVQTLVSLQHHDGD